MDLYLGDLQLFEIEEYCRELDEKKTLYFKKYEYGIEIEITFEETLEETLDKLLREENFEEASKIRDLINKKKEK